MPLNKANLGNEIKSAIEAAYGSAADDPTLLKKFCDAVASAVVDHIQANAVVNVNNTGTVSSGVGAGGTTIGTGIGTVS